MSVCQRCVGCMHTCGEEAVAKRGRVARGTTAVVQRLLGVAFLLATLPWLPGSRVLAQTSSEAVPVVVAEVSRMELSRGQSFVGTVYPFRESDVGSAVDGRLVSLPIEDGQQVRKGDTLAELLRGLLEIERSGAVAELDKRRQELAELEAGSRPEEIEQASAETEGLEARLTYAESRLARLEKLFERGTATTDELQDGQTELRQIKAELRAKQAALSMVEAGPRREVVAQAAAAVAAAKTKLEAAKKDVAAKKAAMDAESKNYEATAKSLAALDAESKKLPETAKALAAKLKQAQELGVTTLDEAAFLALAPTEGE